MMFSTLFRKLFRNGLAVVLLAVPMTALASSTVHLDRAPINVDDHESLQRGARTFTNYCLSCHAASYMRFVRMTDIGLTEAQIKDNLLFTTDKVGSLMTVAMRPNDAKDWFGAPPPDLSVISRARGADWLYTYLRGFYRDDTRASGGTIPSLTRSVCRMCWPICKAIRSPSCSRTSVRMARRIAC